MRRAGLAFTRFLALAALCCGGASCKYDPQPEDGTLLCSTGGECPEGYSCRLNTCWANAGSRRDAGLGGSTLPAALVTRYVGRWLLDLTSKVVTRCDDGVPQTTLLSPPLERSTMTIQVGTPGFSDLDSMWLCDLSLRLDSTGAYLFDDNPTCSDANEDPVQTWTTTQFKFVTTNGTTATHTAHYNRLDQFADGSVSNCGQTVTATMTKQ